MVASPVQCPATVCRCLLLGSLQPVVVATTLWGPAKAWQRLALRAEGGPRPRQRAVSAAAESQAEAAAQPAQQANGLPRAVPALLRGDRAVWRGRRGRGADRTTARALQEPAKAALGPPGPSMCCALHRRCHDNCV